jgi:hypothetical protein
MHLFTPTLILVLDCHRPTNFPAGLQGTACSDHLWSLISHKGNSNHIYTLDSTEIQPFRIISGICFFLPRLEFRLPINRSLLVNFFHNLMLATKSKTYNSGSDIRDWSSGISRIMQQNYADNIKIVMCVEWLIRVVACWFDDPIYLTLWYSACLHFTVHYYTHTSVHSYVFPAIPW